MSVTEIDPMTPCSLLFLLTEAEVQFLHTAYAIEHLPTLTAVGQRLGLTQISVRHRLQKYQAAGHLLHIHPVAGRPGPLPADAREQGILEQGTILRLREPLVRR